MTIFSTDNFSGPKVSRLDLLNVQNGDTFESCNFAQRLPNTEILDGIENLTFIQCNLKNVKMDATWERQGGINSQTSMCSHLHPEKSELPECDEDCSHVIDTDVITIDGVVVDTIFTYKDTRID